MKYCSHCGKEIMEAAVICPHCGCAVNNQMTAEEDIPSMGLNIISLLIPLVGLILYVMYHDKTPKKANEIGKFALIGVGIGIAIYVLAMCATISMY